MPQHVVESDKPWSIEQHAIEPIPHADRHGSPGELFRLWVGANVNYVVLITGSLAIVQGLSFQESIWAVVIGNLLGCATVGFASIMGPKTGTAGIVTTRTSFGQLGAVLPIVISTLAAIGWFSINSVIATEGLAKLFAMIGLPQTTFVSAAALGVVLVAEILIAIFGHATIIAAEKWGAFALVLLFLVFALLVTPKIDFAASAAAHPPAKFATWLIRLAS